MLEQHIFRTYDFSGIFLNVKSEGIAFTVAASCVSMSPYPRTTWHV